MSKFCCELLVTISRCLENFFFQWKSYILWVFVIICYYLLLFVFWPFKWCLTFKNVCVWSLKQFRRKNNVWFTVRAAITVDLGWFWWIWNAATYQKYHVFAWKTSYKQCQNVFYQLEPQLTSKQNVLKRFYHVSSVVQV